MIDHITLKLLWTLDLANVYMYGSQAAARQPGCYSELTGVLWDVLHF